MKVVILGAGYRSIKLAKHLAEEHADVTLIDENPNVSAKTMTLIDCLAVTGSGTDAECLKEAGIENAYAFIALSGSDETNLISCGIASSQFKVPVTIAAVANISYARSGDYTDILGVTHIVNPDQEIAKHIYRSIDRGIYSDSICFDNSSLTLNTIHVEKKSQFAGKFVKNLRRTLPGDYIIAVLNRGSEVFVPSGDTQIEEGDTIGLVATDESIENILAKLGKKKKKNGRIVIIGGTQVVDFLLHLMKTSFRKRTTVISKDKNFCEKISSKYSDVLVTNENISNEGVFRQESLDGYNLLLSLTDNDELNFLVASFAKHIGVTNSIAMVNKKPDFAEMVDFLNIDSLVLSQDVMVDSVMRYLQSPDVSNTHTVFDGKIEVFEYSITEGNKLCGKQLKDIDMKNRGLIAGSRKADGKTVIPGGTYLIETGDTLTVVARRSELDFIRELLEMKTPGEK